MKLFLALIITFNTFSVYADCPELVQPIKVNEKANCNGLLYSVEADLKAAKDHYNAKLYKEINDKLTEKEKLIEKQNEILEKRLNNYIEQSLILSEQLSKKEQQSEWNKIIWFSLRIIATGTAVYGARQLQR